MKKLVLLFTVLLSLSSCTKDDCYKTMIMCNDEIGICYSELVEMPCYTDNGYFDGTFTYRDFE